MASISIDTVLQFAQYLVRKNGSGSLSPSQFNLIINRASMTEFVNRTGNPHQYVPGQPIPQMGFQITQKITEDLKVFQVNANLMIDNLGQADYPSDMAYTIPGLGYKTQENGQTIYVPIKIVDKDKLFYRLWSKIVAPTRKFPIAVMENTYIQIHPTDISNITFTYLKYPTEAVWAYTTVNGRPVFDAENSVDMEWENAVVNDIVIRALKSIGISIKDADVVAFANQEIQQGA